MKVKITTALHYGAFDAELDDGASIPALFDEEMGALATLYFLDSQTDERVSKLTIRKEHIQAVEEEV